MTNTNPRTITLNMPVEVVVEDELDETGMVMNGGGLSVIIVRVPSIQAARKAIDEQEQKAVDAMRLMKLDGGK